MPGCVVDGFEVIHIQVNECLRLVVIAFPQHTPQTFDQFGTPQQAGVLIMHRLHHQLFDMLLKAAGVTQVNHATWGGSETGR
jgi:hypothetical protein